MNTALILSAAMILDAIFGEPKWLWSRLPHPAVLMGRAVAWCDRSLNRGPGRRAKGVCAVFLLSVGAGCLGWMVSWGGPLVECIVAAIILAQKSLVDHVRAVAAALRISLGDGRHMVGMIVGRDTSSMEVPDVARGAIESAAENLSDGVIAPAFWFLVAGLPGMLIYKIVNTADSMIGYRNERYEAFGWAAARFDDLLNLIPARLSGVLIALTHARLSDWTRIAADARLHRSPNAGWPEAAMARALGIALSGPRSYDGEMREFPYVNASGKKDIGADDVDAACGALWRTWVTGLVAILFMTVVTS